MVTEGLNGNVSKSNEIHYKLYPLYNSLYKDGNPAGIKECLSYLETVSYTHLTLPTILLV